MHDEIIPILNNIIRQYGRAVYADPGRLNALLLDLAGDFKLETRLLVLSARENIPEQLLSTAHGMPEALLLSRLMGQLREGWGLTWGNAEWTIKAWNQALDLPPVVIPVLQPEPPISSITGVDAIQVYPPDSTITPGQDSLLAIMLNTKRAPLERASAGREINHYGDPRPGVVDFNFAVDYWCRVPAGSFTDQLNNRGYIPYDYWMGKYLVTYAQYRAFIDDPRGYRNSKWWGDLHSVGKTQQKMGADDQKWAFANHPAERVSWYDAMAFCAWVNTKLTLDRSLKSQGYRFRLPTESEWEKASRGTDGREYPWGNGYEFGFANTREGLGGTDLEQTTAVGIYPQGASPYGILDMLGNVWEWTLTKYSDGNSDVSQKTRGSSWYTDVSQREPIGIWGADIRNFGIGFRMCCGPALYKAV